MDSHNILMGNKLVYLSAQFSKQMELFSKLVKLCRAVKHKCRHLVASPPERAKIPLKVCAAGSVPFDRLVKSCMHYFLQILVTLSFFVNLILTLPPRNIDRDADAEQASGSLNPVGKVHRLNAGAACPAVEKAPAGKQPKAYAHRRKDDRVSVWRLMVHFGLLSLGSSGMVRVDVHCGN